jgi:hypothetical protein
MKQLKLVWSPKPDWLKFKETTKPQQLKKKSLRETSLRVTTDLKF